MVKTIVKDEAFLAQKSEIATEADLDVCKDLLDTLDSLKDECVGLAANMIGSLKRIICVEAQGRHVVMINPVIVKTSKTYYEAEEGCLSLEGTRKTNRFFSVRVEYLDMDFKKRVKTFEGFDAEVIQHEMDHLEGIII